MNIGVVVESFREPLFQALETAVSCGIKGVQMYAVCKDHDLIRMSDAERRALKAHIAKLDGWIADRKAEQEKLLAEIDAAVAALSAAEEEIEDEYKRLAAAYSMEVEDVKARMAAEDVKTDLLARKAGSLIAENAVAVAPKAEEAPEEAPAAE